MRLVSLRCIQLVAGQSKFASVAVYSPNSIPEHWIANLEAQELEVFWLPVGGAYQHNEVWRAGDVVRAQYLELVVQDILP
jgi:hypothetical protein